MTVDNKRPLKVFLCHAHADRDPVRGLYTRLTQDGVDAWLDKEKLLPGQDWELEIRKAVREADVVVVCLSKQFNQAGFRQKEVRLALDTAMEKPEGEIFIIPARLEECDNLESLRKWHWVDLFEDDGYEMLKRALRARADKIGAALRTRRKATKSHQNANSGKAGIELQIKSLYRQAERHETNHEFSKALDFYYEIEKIDPFFPGLDQKLTELENKKEKSEHFTEYISKVLDDKPSAFPSFLKIIVGGIVVLALILVVTLGIPSLVGKLLQTQRANATSTAGECIPTSDMGCFTIQARDPYNSSIKVSGVTVTFTRHDNGTLIFSGITDENGEVQFLCPFRPVYYDFTISGYSDGSVCSDSSGNSIAAPTYDAFMWLQPSNPGGNGKCNWGNDR